MRNKRILTVLAIATAAAAADAAPMSRLKSVGYNDGDVRVTLDAAATWTTTPWRSANRYIIDINAAGADPKEQKLAVDTPRLKAVRWTQFKPDTVRVVLDLPDGRLPVMVTKSPADVIVIRVAPPAQQPQEPKTPPSVTTTKPGVDENGSPAVTAKKVHVDAISVERGEDGRPVRIVVQTDQAVEITPIWRDNRLLLKLPDSEPGPEQIVPVNDEALLRVRTAREDDGAVVIADFTTPVTCSAAPLAEGTGFSVTLDFVTPPVLPEPPPDLKCLTGTTIVIDAGHGGRDLGTRSTLIREKDINLDVALRLRNLLTPLGVNVVMTRDGDTLPALRQRPQIAMDANADAFVSIHINYAPANFRGAEVWYRRGNAESKRLASSLLRAHLDVTKFYGRGVKPESHAPGGGLAVLKHNTVPCALLELGFVNNSTESKAMAKPEWRQKVAEGMVTGLARFMEGRL